MRSINIIIIEPRTLLREGLVSLLRGSDFRVILDVATPDKVSQAALERANILIIGTSNEPTEILGYLKQHTAATQSRKIVIITEVNGQISQPDIMKCLSNGADCCIFNVRSREVLLRSLHLVVLGQRVVVFGQESGTPDTVTLENKPSSVVEYEPRAGSDYAAQLSAREIEILSFIVAGDSNKAIARTCRLAESTVKIHLKTILRKIGVRNRTQAAIWAIHNVNGSEVVLPAGPVITDGDLKHSLQGGRL